MALDMGKLVADVEGLLNGSEQIDIDMNDPQKYMAPRHRGKVNALFADGHVEQLVPETITAGQLSTKPGD